MNIRRTVNDSTDDLVNLADARGIGAGESGGQGGEAIDGLAGTSGDGGRSRKSSPPEGPGKTAETLVY